MKYISFYKKSRMVIVFMTFAAFFIASCDSPSGQPDLSKDPIVSVNGHTLYRTTLEKILPSGLSKEDSIAAADKYVKGWIGGVLLLDLAEKNIVDKVEIDQMVTDYRNSLVVNAYQERLLKQELSKEIAESELEAFYASSPQLFKLEENIIKGLYLKVPKESPLLDDFKKWYKQTTDDAINNLEKNALQHAVNYDYFYDHWTNFSSVLDKIPTQISDPTDYLNKNKTIFVQDSSFVYMLNIQDVKMVGEEAPYEYAKDKILDILIKKRKKDFTDQMQEDLYDKGMKNNDIKFHQ